MKFKSSFDNFFAHFECEKGNIISFPLCILDFDLFENTQPNRLTLRALKVEYKCSEMSCLLFELSIHCFVTVNIDRLRIHR